MSGGGQVHADGGQIGRADLVRALASGETVRDEVASLLGFRRAFRQEPDPPRQPGGDISDTLLVQPTGNRPRATIVETLFEPEPVSFWYAESLRLREVVSDEGDSQETALAVSRSRDVRKADRAIFEPLAPMADLLTRLRRLSEFERPGSELDVDRLVGELGRGRIPAVIPRRAKRSWGAGLHVIQDLSSRLTPYRIDQGLLSLELKDRLPKTAATLSSVCDGDLEPFVHWPDESHGMAARFEPGSTVLVLGDLGILDHHSVPLIRQWREFGERLADRQIQRAALVPCDLDSVSSELSQVWTVLPWDRSRSPIGAPAREELNRMAERLLALLSFAVVIEPRLLRQVRRAIPEFRPLAELESLVWQHRAIRASGIGGATLEQEQRNQLDQIRAQLSEHLRRTAIDYVVVEHAANYEGVRYAEILNLGNEARQVFSEDEIRLAKEWYGEIDRDPPPSQCELRERIEFFRVVAPHLNQAARRQCPALDRNWARYFAGDPTAVPPSDFDPARLKPRTGGQRRVHIRQWGATFELSIASADATSNGSPLADIRLGADRIRIDYLDRDPSHAGFDINRDFWAAGERPQWASAWGIDRFGPWAEFQVDTSSGPVRQRMRWIAAGKFRMGSPDDEPGRYQDEGPRHDVTISRGFWMFDAPCTQALWSAVMGSNPSRFQSPTRPVERVSWKDCGQFLEKLRQSVPGLEGELPTEAEWEFACRAGTTEATYAGPIEILGACNAPVLDAIAWYGGNSGRDFELENGDDASHWSDKQYEFDKAGTHPVALKAPNPSGLYDMLGNVWEWCRDAAYRQYSSPPQTDPLNEAKVSARRVIRGGSWDDDARVVRAAVRFASDPGYRFNYLGFRCRVLGCEPSQWAAEPQRRTERAASGRPTRSGVDNLPARDVGGPNAAPASHDPESRAVERPPALTGRQFLERLAQIPISDLPRPAWASDFGRDKFGVYAEFQVRPKSGPPVTQRLRLIPPGTFLMGSPDDEDGRWDNEGPRHEVTISQAFWMFDTPCTQALWKAVIRKNPSHFKGDDCPVESVIWEDCAKFNQGLVRMIGGLEPELPTEAEWEYACRAGTVTATYAGDLKAEGSRAADLDAIAWYSGNSGRRTHPVGTKQANAWGLFDMLGNVWEWCIDEMRTYRTAAVTDPGEPAEATAVRVIRGGSWNFDARSVRAACRDAYHSGYRRSSLGFRCRVQARELQQAVAGSKVQAIEDRASGEHRNLRSGGDSESTSVVRAAWFNLIEKDSDQAPVPTTVCAKIVTDVEEITLRRIVKPSWASAIGRDPFGLWAEFQVPFENPQAVAAITSRTEPGVVTQRLRWIPPGRFLMGSPKDEPGRYDEYEFEPRECLIERGFWLFDTPCTQSLWSAVMGENPSRFKSTTRPVEQVSWNDCQQFIARFNRRAQAAQLSLPTEAQWEYACRAGTGDATYAGPMQIVGSYNAPILDAIAWYGGNSGVGFELERGAVASWSEKQHEFQQAGTRVVATKAPNAWGLYDMLGNVQEWCRDGMRSYRERDEFDPVGSETSSVQPVVRGGNWKSDARSVRAANRQALAPADRRDDLGFRCVVR